MSWELKGVITALITPLNKDSDLCEDCLKELISYQLTNGVNGLFIMGTYGEGLLLSQKTRRKFLEKAIEYVPNKAVVLPHIASSDVEASYELAKYARDLGYEVVSSVGPVYYKSSKRGLVEYFNRISKSDAKVVIYNNSGRQRYNITPSMFEELTREVPAIVGIKDTSYSVEQLLEYVMRFKGKYFVAGAGDNMLLYTFVIGADAHICGLSNVFPKYVTELYRAVVNGDIEKAKEIQNVINKLRNITGKFSVESPEVLRELLKLKGINAGYPLTYLGVLEPQEREELRKLVEQYLTLT